MLFLLTNDQGRALLMAQTTSQAEADTFGRNHLPDFCGESVEIDMASRMEAEEFWDVRTVRLVNVRLDADAVVERCYTPAGTVKKLWVRSPELPEEVESAGLLTEEDRAAITLDHIARTSDLVGRLEIFKWS